MNALITPLLFALLGVSALFAEDPSVESPAGAFKVVVHAKHSRTAVSSDELSRLFLDAEPAWSDGSGASPVDQARTSEVRVAFSEAVLGRKVTSVKSYWQQMVFSGRGAPPPELRSDVEVLDYVRSHPAAVGYVSVHTPIDPSIKVLEIQ